ncbi:MAG TPA: 50S ribosomal protein L13 [Candidatus Paceibacterota bacterium]|nr:50S ribosomal protein L13 [Candidatus Paceibacterota bacterium]HRZ34546.1 50S ribosomal protein L13 [Candidatus Paceibacterota bacterium]
MKTIDAQNKTLGRIASAAAKILMGKDEAKYTPHISSGAKVQIINASKMKIDSRKARDTKHSRYSHYPGGLKFASWSETIAKKGYAELVRKAVSGMLPTNTLKKGRMKNLEILD